MFVVVKRRLVRAMMRRIVSRASRDALSHAIARVDHHHAR
jgi:hypothetical protein